MKVQENPFNIGDRVRVRRGVDRGPRTGVVTAYYNSTLEQVTQGKAHVCMIQWDDGDWSGYGWANLELVLNGVDIMVRLL